VHYRDLYTNIDKTNYQTSTKADFKRVKIPTGKDVHSYFSMISQQHNIISRYRSKTGSKYAIDEDGNVYRASNHWGAVASCQWTLEGEGQLCMSIFETGDWELGVANLRDFEVFRRAQEKRADFLLNPKWVEGIKAIIPTKEKLEAIKFSQQFEQLSPNDKELVGRNWGKFTAELKMINT
jgi:hypothetical protein